MVREPSMPAWPGGNGHRLETAAAGRFEIGAARRATAADLRRWGCSNVDDAVIVLSELVTNAVLHGGGADRIVVDCDDAWIHISVHDNRTEPPRLREPSRDGGGRGLHIVEALARRWGSESLIVGKTVWAILPRQVPGGEV